MNYMHYHKQMCLVDLEGTFQRICTFAEQSRQLRKSQVSLECSEKAIKKLKEIQEKANPTVITAYVYEVFKHLLFAYIYEIFKHLLFAKCFKVIHDQRNKTRRTYISLNHKSSTSIFTSYNKPPNAQNHVCIEDRIFIRSDATIK